MKGVPLPKAYDFSAVERRWYGEWISAGLFRADAGSDRPAFSMVIPPPNVTGVLHIGHALNNTLQDILVRYKRMDGFDVLWVPGTDHAGIATQNVVERQLAAEGKTRDDLGRDEFIARVWRWRQESGGHIIEQLKRLGCSCDWSRERFTMDDGLSRAVREVFVRLFEEGLIYKGDRIINWCPRCHTALADIEVEHEMADGRIWYIRYPVSGGGGHVTVATTRPETMLGDTAVAVHPDDVRYSAVIGRMLHLPLMERDIPVVADDTVDPAFGTGAVKVTPAHDFNDFETARRHGLPAIDIFDKNAHIKPGFGPYSGLDRYEARKKIIEDLKAQGLLEKEESYSLAAGGCYRCKTTVEPRLSKQWFVKVAPLAGPALKAVLNGETRIMPASWIKTYEEWMTNIRDWCISRQIWWGHRIPAWECKACGELIVARETPKTCPRCGGLELIQEEDVLDTWFSSALWPFSTLGWPDETLELRRYYPTSVLITSFDILFFWVARMMMMGLHFMGDVPFVHVYLHALVRDGSGQKMSKSKGNVIDPITIMDRYGTDAVRFTLCSLAAQGRDIKLSEERIEGYRHFVNKIWNAARLVLMNLGGRHEALDAARVSGLTALAGLDLADCLYEKWILSRLSAVIAKVRAAFDNFDFDVAAREMYQFFWHEFCDWYLELAKPSFSSNDAAKKRTARVVSLIVLDNSLRLLHPIMPFVTEELWHSLPGRQGYIMTAPFPMSSPEFDSPEAEALVNGLIEVVTAIRNIRAELNIHPGAGVKVMVIAHSQRAMDIMESHGPAISTLARVEEIVFLPVGGRRPSGAATVILEDLELFVPVEGLVDIEGEIKKATREEKRLASEIEKAMTKLAREDFLSKAPREIIEKEREKLKRFEAQMEKIVNHKKMLESAIGSRDRDGQAFL
ncbi:MAG: valine--tRNA ligase [Dissulfurimicrobium sp.]|uniref:valine--tRNA ligase n=1 Tax=Dissulfurimicrobium TaxID=1769732 RepID=UPI0038B3ADD6